MKQVLNTDMQTDDFARSVHVVNVTGGQTIKDILAPEYWALVALNMRVGDRIEAHYHNWTWAADLVVTAVDGEKKVWAKVKILHFYPLRDETKHLPESEASTKFSDDKEFEIKNRGAIGWSVVRKSDKAVVFENGKGRDAAVHWIETYRRKVAA